MVGFATFARWCGFRRIPPYSGSARLRASSPALSHKKQSTRNRRVLCPCTWKYNLFGAFGSPESWSESGPFAWEFPHLCPFGTAWQLLPDLFPVTELFPYPFFSDYTLFWKKSSSIFLPSNCNLYLTFAIRLCNIYLATAKHKQEAKLSCNPKCQFVRRGACL